MPSWMGKTSVLVIDLLRQELADRRERGLHLFERQMGS